MRSLAHGFTSCFGPPVHFCRRENLRRIHGRVRHALHRIREVSLRHHLTFVSRRWFFFEVAVVVTSWSLGRRGASRRSSATKVWESALWMQRKAEFSDSEARWMKHSPASTGPQVLFQFRTIEHTGWTGNLSQ